MQLPGGLDGRVEERRGAASAIRFLSPLIKRDVRISRIRLSDWFHRGHTADSRYERHPYPRSALTPRYSSFGKLLVLCGALQAVANSPTLAFFNKPTRSQGPSLPRRYPASAVLRPCPTPARSAAVSGVGAATSDRVGLPRCPHHRSDVPCPLPRRIETGALVDCFPAHAAFPVLQAGRHPLLYFRGLLRLHSRYGPSDCSTPHGGLCHEASIQPVARPNRSSATRVIDNSLGGTSLHW